MCKMSTSEKLRKSVPKELSLPFVLKYHNFGIFWSYSH